MSGPSAWPCDAGRSIEPEIVDRAEVIAAPVASTGDLIALKLLARDDVDRAQDALDLRALAGVASPTDWAVAAEACRDIAGRGFHRGRDLAALLEGLRGTSER